MARNEVVDRDKGWKRIRRQARELKDSGVKVGVLGDAERDDGADMILIALANEFGTDTIPARPFIRGAYGEHKQDLGNTKDRLVRLVFAGKIDVPRALGLLGEEHKGQIQEYMTALDHPPNAPSTIARKRGSTNPLIDTGQLRRSIDWERD